MRKKIATIPKAAKCNHDWIFEQAVYAKATVHRQCVRCGIHQVGVATKFRTVEIGPSRKWDLPDLTEQSETL